MKRFMLLLVTMICFAGCYEVTGEIIINENASGSFNTKMDMGQMLEMIQSTAGEDDQRWISF